MALFLFGLTGKQVDCQVLGSAELSGAVGFEEEDEEAV
jgi:hypothetical protein